MKRPLIIGYGNPLREDDGIGPRAIELLARSFGPGGARVMECRQLAPELAVDIEEASLVIFLDAALDQAPGEIKCVGIDKTGSGGWSHHLTPRQLLALVEEPPPAYAITCGISKIGWSEGLSAEGEELAAKMAAAALNLLREPKPRVAVRASDTIHPALRP